MSLLKREEPAAAFIPISSHPHPNVGRTQDGHYVIGFRLGGCSYESADDEEINNWHKSLNNTWRNVGGPNWAIWTHVIRDDTKLPPHTEPAAGFARDTDRKYSHRLDNETLMANELFVALVYRPQATAAEAGALKLLARSNKTVMADEMKDSIDQCLKKQGELLAALHRYDPEPLGAYVHEGLRFSSLLELYGRLVNGEWQRMPLARAPLNEVVATSHVLFGTEAIEYRMPTRTRYGALIGIKEYPTISWPGIFASLLRAPWPFVLSQSYTFIPKGAAQKLMESQLRRMNLAEDPAVSQRGELLVALDHLISNRFTLGDHHLTLQVMANAFEGVKEAEGEPRLRQLNDNVAHARALLGDTGMVTARESLGLKSSYWAQLPGAFRHRTRKSPITSLNFSGKAPFLNFPTGRLTGNHWGEALTTFVTSARAPYHFSLHASDPKALDGGSRKDVGHMIGIAPNGGGKTTLIGFLAAQVTKFNARQVIFDKGEGLHILVKALGGEYLPLKSGVPTGCNPLQLDITPFNVEFMRAWLRRLAMRSPDERLTVAQELDLDQALDGVIPMAKAARRLSRLVEFLDPTDAEGVFARLKPWCEGGPHGWVFDNRIDRVIPLLTGNNIVGFDVTDFLDDPIVRPTLTMYLFHLVKRMVGRGRMVVWCDEFAKLIDDPAFAGFAKDSLEGWRKKDACFIGFTQMASHVTRSKIAASILEQCATKIAWPNPDGNIDEYTTGKEGEAGFGFSLREFALIQETMEPGSRQFLIRQGHNSVVAKLDLKGFDFELNVISGRDVNVALMHRAIATHGPDPKDWLPGLRSLIAIHDKAPLDFVSENTHA